MIPNNYPQKILIFYSPDDKGYICTIPVFPNLSAFGETPVIALAEGLIAYEGMKEILTEELK